MQSSKWIVSAKWDLTFFTGSVLLTYAFYGVFQALLLLPETHFLNRNAGIITTVAFYTFFDHPHIFQTFSRTHADSNEYARRKHLYTYGLLLFILCGYGIRILHWEAPFETFLNLYGVWHILRQNSGFLRLYKKRAHENSILDRNLDYGILYGSVIIFLLIRISDKKREVLDWIPTLDFNKNILICFFCLTLITYALRQLCLLRKGELHLPKLLFLTAIISTYYFTYVYATPPLGLMVVLETAYHDIQYQGWVSHFQKRRFSAGAWKKWLGASMAYGFIFGCLLIYSFVNDLTGWLITPFIMLVLFHYYIDGKIWRFSNGPELKKVYDF